MTEATAEITAVVTQLEHRILSLEERIAVLEGGSPKPSPPVSSSPGRTAASPERPPATWQGFPSIEIPGAVSTLGKAVVGLAGAYLLRATAESGMLPKIPVVIAAAAYAAVWLLWAVRANRDRFTSVTYGITSLLILSPMLWEATVGFQFVSPGFAGAILVAFFLCAIALSWKRDLLAIPWFAAVACALTALSLIVGTHDLVPLTVAILTMALSIEVAGYWGRLTSVRTLTAITADIAVLLLIDILGSSSGVPEGYRPTSANTIIAIWFALMAIYIGSIGVRSFWLRRPITGVDIGQGTLCLLIAGFGALRSAERPVGVTFGAGLLALSAVCYWANFTIFAEPQFARNRRISAIWSPILLIAAASLLFPPNLQVTLLCVASLIATWVYTRTAKLSLGIHASVFLAAGAIASPFPDYVTNALAGTVPAAPGWGVAFAAICSGLCYLLGSRISEGKTARRILWVLPAAILAFSFAAMSIAAITWLAAGRLDLSASRMSVIRTLVNCTLALILAYLSVKARRIELGWVAYAAVAFGTLKLLFEDLRYGNPASLVLSLLFYGLVLIALPRLVRQGRADHVPSEVESVSA